MRIDRGTIAVIAGGAGGIGRAFAAEISRAGGTVVVLDVDRSGTDPVVQCDIRDPAAVERVAQDIGRTHGAVSLLINAAGVSVAGTVEEVPLAAFVNAMDVNFWGTVHTSRSFLPHLRRSRASGRPAAICNILSDFAFISLPTKSAYAASKHAARAFTEALGAELHDAGIVVTAAYVGATATDLVARGFAIDRDKQAREAAFLRRGMPPERVAQKVLDAVAHGRSRVTVGADAKMLDLASRISPAFVHWMLRRLWRRVPFL